MSENKTEVLVGGLVLAAAVGFLVYAGQVAGLGQGSAGYPLHASFRSLEGVQVGTDVRLAGVKIGSVTDVALNTQTFRADTVFTVASDIAIPDDSAVVIAQEGLLGGNFVEIVPAGRRSTSSRGQEIEDTQGAVSLISLLLKFVAGKEES